MVVLPLVSRVREAAPVVGIAHGSPRKAGVDLPLLAPRGIGVELALDVVAASRCRRWLARHFVRGERRWMGIFEKVGGLGGMFSSCQGLKLARRYWCGRREVRNGFADSWVIYGAGGVHGMMETERSERCAERGVHTGALLLPNITVLSRFRDIDRGENCVPAAPTVLNPDTGVSRVDRAIAVACSSL